MNTTFERARICEQIISDGCYMLDPEKTYCEDYPDEFVSEEVFQIACDVVRHLVMNGFTNVSMYHSGKDVGIDGKNICIEVSKNSIAGFCKLKNYKTIPQSSNVIKFVVDWNDDGIEAIETFRKIVVGLSFHFN